MVYASLPDDTVRKLPFYLAMEEYLARNFDKEYFFMWQVKPTVIFGRNQVSEAEVNIPYCKEKGIEMYRRKSGGGCVYADMDNIMFSYIVSGDDVTAIFRNYTSKIAAMLQTLGVDARSSGRNDVLIHDKKVSGNSFYHTPGRCIVHGTMLYDTDIENMLNAIYPSKTKLDSKGVSSVKSHITTLTEHTDISLDDFKKYVKNYLCDEEFVLSDVDIAEVESIAEPYYSDSWIKGKNPQYGLHRNIRIEGVGEFYVDIQVKHNRINDLNLSGDFFVLGDIDNEIVRPLQECDYESEAINNVLSRLHPEKTIAGLSKEHLLKLLI